MSLKHAKTSVAGSPVDPLKVGGDDWNADHVIDTGGAKVLTRSDNPPPPTAGEMLIFGKSLASSSLPAYIGSSGVASPLQPMLGTNKISLVSYASNSAVNAGISTIGLSFPTTFGSQVARSAEPTSFFEACRRRGFVGSGTGTNSRAGLYGQPEFFRGDIPGVGGFRAIFRFGCSDLGDLSATGRTIVGFVLTSAAIGGVPTVATNCIFMGTNTGEANFSIFHNDGSGTASQIPLGPNFPDHTSSVDMYELALFCAPNSDRIGYQVTRLNRPDIQPVAGIITSDLPSPTQKLLPNITRINGSSTVQAGIDVIGYYIETEN